MNVLRQVKLPSRVSHDKFGSLAVHTRLEKFAGNLNIRTKGSVGCLAEEIEEKGDWKEERRC